MLYMSPNNFFCSKIEECPNKWKWCLPSVESIAIVLTLLSPKCWATSRIKVFSVPYTSKEFKIAGKSPSNWTSTTAPII